MSEDVEYADLITLNPTHDDVARIGNMIENYIKGLDDRARETYEENLSHCFVNFDVGVMTALLSEPADPNSITLLIATRYKALLDHRTAPERCFTIRRPSTIRSGMVCQSQRFCFTFTPSNSARK